MKWTVWIGEQPVEVDSADLENALLIAPGVYSILHEGRSYEVRVTEAEGALRASVNGRDYLAEVRDQRDAPSNPRAGLGEGRQKVIAPMPGKVIRVLVGEGDAVEAGQGLIVVEAMKMQNEMKSPKAGHVAQLTAKAGGAVAAGEVLAIIE